MQITFDHVVQFTGAVEQAFQVRKRGIGGGAVGVEAFVTVNTAANQTTVILAFRGNFVESSGSLGDGNYDLIVRSEFITAVNSGLRIDGDRDGVAGGDFRFGSNANDQAVAADAFFRLFGDSDGDGDVDNADLGRFNSAFRKRIGQSGYDDAFDFQSDGIIDNVDLGNFNLRYRKRINFQ